MQQTDTTAVLHDTALYLPTVDSPTLFGMCPSANSGSVLDFVNNKFHLTLSPFQNMTSVLNIISRTSSRMHACTHAHNYKYE